MNITIQYYLEQGYSPGAPSQQAEDIDAAVAERTPCRRCGGTMYSQGFHKPGAYIVYAVCRLCGYSVEF